MKPYELILILWSWEGNLSELRNTRKLTEKELEVKGDEVNFRICIILALTNLVYSYTH